MSSPIRLLAVAASTNQHSLNRALLTVAMQQAEAAGAAVTLLDYAACDCPNYSDDQFNALHLPAGAKCFADAMDAHDGLLCALPEYNWSYPGGLKNIIDWISRLDPVPIAQKSALLLSASPSLQGGIKGLLHFRVPLEALGMHVHPKMFTLSDALNALTAEGTITIPKIEQDLNSCIQEYVNYAKKLAA